MRVQRILVGLVVTVWVGLIGYQPAQAHHAFAAEFDANSPVRVQGALVKVDWTNPHTWWHVDVKTPSGTVERWMFEGGGPGSLTRRGFGRRTLPIGAEVVLEGYLSKGVPRRANARAITYADGRTLFVGSSGTGAPEDGRDPTETKTKKP